MASTLPLRVQRDIAGVLRTVASAAPLSVGRVGYPAHARTEGRGDWCAIAEATPNPAAVRLPDRFELNGDMSENGPHWRLYAPSHEPAIARPAVNRRGFRRSLCDRPAIVTAGIGRCGVAA